MASMDTTGLSTSSIMASYGVPDSVWMPIQTVESGGDANAYTNSGRDNSVGLFQLNINGGLGSGYTVSQLKNPTLNATIAAKSMAPYVATGKAKGLTGYALTQYVAYNGGWPTQQGVGALATDPVVASYDTKLQSAYSGNGGSSLSSSSGSGGAGSSSSTNKTSLLSIGGVDLVSTNTSNLVSGVWTVIGVMIVGLGIYTLTNPLSNLTDILSKWKMGGVKASAE